MVNGPTNEEGYFEGFRSEWGSGELVAARPPEKLTISEWTEKYRFLQEPAEEKGPLRLKRTPYLRPILDAFLDREVEEVVVCKSAQIAGTEGMLSVVGFYAAQESAPIMVVMADEDTAKYIARERIHRMFRTLKTKERLVDESMMGLNEIVLKNGAYIAMGWASSVAKLASRPIRIVIFDEVDKPGYLVTTKEAGPISLGIERTETFFNIKIGILSTPTDEFGNISIHLTASDVIFDWHVPCPFCGQCQPLVWNLKYAWGFDGGKYRGDDGVFHNLGSVVWQGGRNATEEQIDAAGYQCGECGAVWTTLQKNTAVELGKPVPRTELPARIRKVGFHLNRLLSLLGKSGDISKLVRDYLNAIKSSDPKELQGFINSTLAQPFKQVLSATTVSDLEKCKVDLEPQHVPEEAIALTCGVDVQKYSFWFTVWAWARDYASWLIHYGQLQTWQDVEDLLFLRQYPIVGHNDRAMRIWRAGVDTGGTEKEGMSMTEEAYWWIRRNGAGRGCRVWATKGSSRPLRGMAAHGNVLDKTPSGRPIPGGLQPVLIDTGQAKDALHYRFGQAKEHLPMGAYLHSGTDKVFFDHIKAEEKRRDNRGRVEWVEVSRDNHLLDASVIAHALADPTWPGGGIQLLRDPVVVLKGPRLPELPVQAGMQQGASGRVSIRSDWLGR